MDGTRNLVSNGELILYGVIDPGGYDAQSIRAIDVIDSLAQIPGPGPITARINSPGGSLTEGLAIYTALKADPRDVIVRVDAIAASAASIVAMVGSEIIMAEGSTMMIHDPYAIAMGTEEQLRATADVIAMQRGQMRDIYAARTGRTPEEITAWMAAETYMTADEAVERGFATRVDEPMRIAACAALDAPTLARLLNAPPTVRAQAPTPAAPAAHPQKDPVMTQANPAGASQATAPDLTAARAEATRLERDRVHSITSAVRAAKLDHTFADELIREGISADDAGRRIITKWSDARAQETGPEGQTHARTAVTGDGVERWIEGARLGIMARAGLKGGERNEFTGMTLVEVARSALNLRADGGAKAHSRMDMVGRAFTIRAEGPGYHASSDFGNVLQNVAQLSMLKGYNEVDETFETWTSKGNLPDFRPASRVDVGLFPAFDKVEEGAEYKYGTFGDTGLTVVLATYGKMFAISRQAIINDQMDVFSRTPERMGRAAKRTIGNLVYATLNSNPVMQDGVALFHANHGNLAVSGAAPGVASLSTARVAMMRQPDLGGVSNGVGIRAKYILVPPELEDQTVVLLNSQYDPAASAGTLKPNSARNFATPVVDNRLSGTAWYLAADQGVTDTVEVSYLDGNDQPFLDEREGWSVDGREYKARIDAGVKALHWRGLFKNAGA